MPCRRSPLSSDNSTSSSTFAPSRLPSHRQFQETNNPLSPEENEETEGFDKSAFAVDASRGDEESHSRWSSAPGIKRSRILAALLSLFSSLSSSSRDKSEETEDALPLLSSGEQLPKPSLKRVWRFRVTRCLLLLLVGFFVMLGIVQFISIVCAVAISFFPDEFDRAATNWLNPYNSSADGLHWPTDISRDIVPVGCHSHNDYWRRVPLFSALQAGCIGVEADVWFMDQNQHRDLYVGHTISALTPERTLRSMYVDPLVKILDRQNPVTPFYSVVDQPPNGVFDTNPAQTLILLVDFKTDGAKTFPHVVEQLSPLRDKGYLTYFNGEKVINGPITVVGTGNTPFDLVTSTPTYRDIFFDAPLHYLADGITTNLPPKEENNDNNLNLGQGLSGTSPNITPDAFNSTNSFYASTSFKNSIGHPWPFHLTAQQMETIRAQVRGAHRRGLKVRYWGLPSWPRGLRNHLWRLLVHEGVDILNVDDLTSATRREWTSRLFDWW